jgi:uncharacterized membrane protein
MGFRYSGLYPLANSGSFPSFLVWLLFKLVLTVATISLIVYVVLRLTSTKGAADIVQGGTAFRFEANIEALKLLNERYVKGELTDEEYLRIKKNLLNLADC